VAEGFQGVVDAERVREMLGPIKFRQQGVAAKVNRSGNRIGLD
jgi:hypothetical protein